MRTPPGHRTGPARGWLPAGRGLALAPAAAAPGSGTCSETRSVTRSEPCSEPSPDTRSEPCSEIEEFQL